MNIVQSETSEGVCTVTLNDIERRNALSPEMLTGLMDAFDQAEADEAVRVIVLTNAGRVFCAGADLSARSQRGGHPESDERSPKVDAVDLFGRFAKSPKPYVGRIAGHCVAGGMGLAAAMDISIAVDTAKMGFTEVRIGVAPAMISVLCLPKMTGADARAAFLRGNLFLAPEAQRMGLINAAVPVDQLDAAVNEVVHDLLAGSPAALASAKQILTEVPAMTTPEAFAWTAALSVTMFDSDDAAEGMAAFLDKRPASWVPPSPSADRDS